MSMAAFMKTPVGKKFLSDVADINVSLKIIASCKKKESDERGRERACDKKNTWYYVPYGNGSQKDRRFQKTSIGYFG